MIKSQNYEASAMSNIFDGQSIMQPMFIKRELIQALNLTASCVVQESNGNAECTKNRYGDRTIAWLKKQNYNFEKLKLSNLSGSTFDVRQKYFMKNIWLLLDE